MYSAQIAHVQSDQAGLAGFGWVGHFKMEVLMDCRDGVLLLFRYASVSNLFLVWSEISARVVTWRNIWQLLRVWRSFAEYPASSKSFIIWWLCCLSKGITHGCCRWMVPLILCKNAHTLVIHWFGIHGRVVVSSRIGLEIPVYIWCALMVTLVKLPRCVWSWRCLIMWRVCCIPCSVWRFCNPIPPCEVGVYTTAFGMFLLYPSLLNIIGVVIEWAWLSIFLVKVVAGRGYVIIGRKMVLYVTSALWCVSGHWLYTFWNSRHHLMSICSSAFWFLSMLMCTPRW